MRDAARLQEVLRELTRILQARDRERAHGYGLTVSQYQGLKALIREGPMTVTSLGEALFLEKSTASRLARSLLDEGLIRRRSRGSDGRVVILQATEQGLRRSRQILNDLAQENMKLLSAFEPADRQALPRLVEALTRALSDRLG